MKTETKAERLTWSQHQTLQRRIITIPSFDPWVTLDFQDMLNAYVKDKCNEYVMNQGEIPNDVVVMDRLSTLDLFIRVTSENFIDNVSPRARVVFFDRIFSTYSNLPEIGEFKPMGAIIFDYGIARPMRYFGFRGGCDNLEIIDSLFWYSESTLESQKLCRKRFEGEEPTLEFSYDVLRYWYGINAILVDPKISDRYWKILDKSRTRWVEDMVKQYPKGIIYNKDVGRVGIEPRRFEPCLRSWHVRGTYTKKGRFRQGYWVQRKSYDELEKEGRV